MNRSALMALILLAVLLILFGMIRHDAASGVSAIPDPVVDETLALEKGQEKVVVAGGCFLGNTGRI